MLAQVPHPNLVDAMALDPDLGSTLFRQRRIIRDLVMHYIMYFGSYMARGFNFSCELLRASHDRSSWALDFSGACRFGGSG